MRFFDTIIIDSNNFSRTNLWQATQADPSFRTVKSVGAFKEAIRHLSNGMKYDLFLISSDFPSIEVSAFIAEAKKVGRGNEGAYVLVLKMKHQQTDSVVSNMVDGSDGFLLEPFTVESLRQTSEIALKVQAHHERVTAKAAIALVLKTMLPVLHEVIEQKSRKKVAEASLVELKKQSAKLKKVCSEHPELYAETLEGMLADAKPKVKKKVVPYSGASERVRRMLEG